MVVFILTRWNFPENASRSYAKQAFTRSYESGILNGIGLKVTNPYFLTPKKSSHCTPHYMKGWGKTFLPFFSKAVISTGVCVYCLLRQTYLQYIETYFHNGVLELSKLPNPDYYGRLGGACFLALVSKLGKISNLDLTVHRICFSLIENFVSQNFKKDNLFDRGFCPFVFFFLFRIC